MVLKMLQLSIWVLLPMILIINALQETDEDLIMMHMYKNMSVTNWTTCPSFLANTTFEPSTFVNVDWTIFYFWNLEYEDSYHVRFSLPSPTLIERFMASLDYDINPPVNWTNAELFLETSIDMTGLFIRTNLTGLFRLIPAFKMQFQMSTEMLFGMKVVDGILGMVNCQRRIAYALAPAEKMPRPDEIENLAAKIGFWNPLGRSYLVRTNISGIDKVPAPTPEELDDAEDDVEEEIERESDVFQMF